MSGRPVHEAEQVAANQLDRVLTPKEVAAWLKVRARQLGVLGVPYLDWGHKTKRYSAKDVQAWLDKQPRVKGRAA